MVHCGPTEFSLKNGKCISELLLVSASEPSNLHSVEHKVELWDGGDLEGLRCISCLISLHGTKDDALVLVGPGCRLKSWLEAHAGWASW